MTETNFRIFAENAGSENLPTDEEYANDETRTNGNMRGSIARSKPNNKALKQSTLMSAAIATYISGRLDKPVMDTDDLSSMIENVNSAIDKHIDYNITVSDKLVHISGEETITGVKQFDVLPESDVIPIKDQHLVNKEYTDNQDESTLNSAKEYTDVEIVNALNKAKDYTDKATEAALKEAKDYADKQMADGGGGGTGGAVLAPEIISPVEGAQDVIITTTFTAGPFRTAYSGNTRTVRQFQATKSTWDDCDFDVEVNSDSYTPILHLDANHDYKWRCRDKSSYGITSPWSAETSFETGGELYVNVPTVSIEDGDTNVSETPLLIGSQFSVNQGEDTHQMTDWRIRESSSGSIVWSSLNDSSNLTTIEVPSGYLNTSTTYTVEVRYKGAAYNWSKWSAAVSFTTSALFDHIQAPSVNITGEPSSVSATPTITASAFTVDTEQGTTDTHQSTDWVIKKGGSIIWQSLNNTSNKTSIVVPRGYLSTSTAYTVEVRYKGVKLGYSAYGSKAFNTKSQFPAIAAPSLTISGVLTSLTETPTLTAGTFSISNGDAGQQDTHQMTDWLVMNSLGTSTIWRSTNNTTSKTSITIPKGRLKENTSYQFKVRYKGANLGWSPYTVKSGRTKTKFAEIKTPVLSITDGTSKVFSRFIAETTGFFPQTGASEDGKVHVSSTWKLYKGTSLVTPIWQSVNDTVNLTEIGVDYMLSPSTTYTLTCQFNGQGEAVSGIASIKFTSSELPSGYLDFTVSKLNTPSSTTLHLNDFFTARWSPTFSWTSSYISQFNVYINNVKKNGITFKDSTIALKDGDRITIKHSLGNNVLYPAFSGEHISSINAPVPKLTTDGNNELNNLSRLFEEGVITKLVDAPFRFYNHIASFERMFLSVLTSLTIALPKYLFYYIDYLNEPQNFFVYGSVVTIPKNFFRNKAENENTINVRYMFQLAYTKSLPSKLLEPICKYRTADLSNLFTRASITSVPEDLFGDATYMPYIDSMFYDCDELASVPVNLFAKLTKVSANAIVMDRTFSSCKKLTPVLRFKFPGSKMGNTSADLFADDCAKAGTLYVPDTTFRSKILASYAPNVNVVVEG